MTSVPLVTVGVVVVAVLHVARVATVLRVCLHVHRVDLRGNRGQAPLFRASRVAGGAVAAILRASLMPGRNVPILNLAPV